MKCIAISAQSCSEIFTVKCLPAGTFAGREPATDSIGVQPQTTWYRTKSATAGEFNTWVLVQNPGASAASVQLNYLTNLGEKAGPTLHLALKAARA